VAAGRILLSTSHPAISGRMIITPDTRLVNNKPHLFSDHARRHPACVVPRFESALNSKSWGYPPPLDATVPGKTRNDPTRTDNGIRPRCQLSLDRIQALAKVREATDSESRFRNVSSAGGGRLFGKSGPNPFVGASVEDHPAGWPHLRDPEGGAAILAVIGRSAQSSGRRGPGEQWRE